MTFLCLNMNDKTYLVNKQEYRAPVQLAATFYKEKKSFPSAVRDNQ